MWENLSSDIQDTFELLASCVDKTEKSLTYHAARDEQSDNRRAYKALWAAKKYASSAEYRAAKSRADRLRYLNNKQRAQLASAMVAARAVAA